MPKPTILVANHIGLLDFLKIWVAFRGNIRFIAKAELFAIPVLGWLFRVFGVISISRGKGDREAIKKALEILQQGGTIGIFIEGKINRRNKQVTMPRNGAAMLAVVSNARVIPVAINKWRAILGQPLEFQEIPGVSRKELYLKINQQIITEINKMLVFKRF
jgi:1-acyl-sn-glycerol-3-phosphate acyltransferase